MTSNAGRLKVKIQIYCGDEIAMVRARLTCLTLSTEMGRFLRRTGLSV
jgi:hypothetical protein